MLNNFLVRPIRLEHGASSRGVFSSDFSNITARLDDGSEINYLNFSKTFATDVEDVDESQKFALHQLADLWLNSADIFLRSGKLADAASCINEAYFFDSLSPHVYHMV